MEHDHETGMELKLKTKVESVGEREPDEEEPCRAKVVESLGIAHTQKSVAKPGWCLTEAEPEGQGRPVEPQVIMDHGGDKRV